MAPSHRKRHGPCGCGSGRPFAACCLPWEESLQRLTARLLRFAAAPAVRRRERGALGVFSQQEGAAPGRQPDLRFLEWFLHDYVPRRGDGPPLGVFADAAVGLDAREEELLLASLLAPVRAYEVSEPPGPPGLVAKDLLSGGEAAVGVIGFDEMPIRSDILVCRLLPTAGLCRTGASVLRLPGTCREELLAYLRTAYQMGRRGRHVALEDFLDASPHLFHHFFESRGRDRGGRAWQTLRQVVFAPGCLSFPAGDRARILASLDRQSELEREAGAGETVRYAWIDLVRGCARAALSVSPAAVEVCAETREDLALAASFVEECLRGLIRTPGQQAPQPAEATTGVRSQERGRPPGGAFLARILTGWPERPSPLLEGRTPRQACGSRAGRQQVAGLLLGLERGLSRHKRLGRAWMDVSFLREALDLLPDQSPGGQTPGAPDRRRRPSMV